MLQENATLPPAARLSIQAMYESIRDQEGYDGSYGAVKDYEAFGLTWSPVVTLGTVAAPP